MVTMPTTTLFCNTDEIKLITNLMVFAVSAPSPWLIPGLSIFWAAGDPGSLPCYMHNILFACRKGGRSQKREGESGDASSCLQSTGQSGHWAGTCRQHLNPSQATSLMFDSPGLYFSPAVIIGLGLQYILQTAGSLL